MSGASKNIIGLLILYRPMTHRGMLLFFNLVSESDWDFVKGLNESVDDKFCIFMGILENAYLQSFPEKIYETRSDQSHRITWFTEELKGMREQVRFLEELNRQYNDIDVSRICKQCKIDYKQAIRRAKIKRNDDIIQTSSNPARAMWDIINEHRGMSKSHHSHSPSIDPNKFNTYFSDIASDLVKDIPKLNIDPSHRINCPTVTNKFVFKEVSFNQVRDIIDNMKNKSSRDIFGLSVKLIKSVKNIILLPLTKLINLCFKKNCFPAILKKATVTPIFKKGDKDNPGNYRPISLLPVISKILEKCMTVQIVDFFEANEYFSKSQFGFRKDKNTTMGILDLVSFILESFHRMEFNAVLMCDLSKAFDCVDHGILVRKLESYNFSPESSLLLKSYLTDRTQVVRVSGVESAESVISIGVPQGSVLGPILFLIYINDLPTTEDGSKYTLFADDTTVSVAADTLEEALEGSLGARRIAEQWFSINRLLLNQEKTQLMVFTLRDMGGEDAGVCSAKFLGVHVDQKLQWGSHIDDLCKNLSRSIFVLRNLASCVSHKVVRAAYFSIFHSRMSYAILVWGHSSGTSRVFGMQRKAVRIISGLGFREDCREAFKMQGILTVPSQFILENLLYVRQNEDLYRTHEDVHGHNTRHRRNLVPAYWRLKRCQSGPGYWSVKFYNVLPNDIKQLSFNNFKNKIRQILVQNAFYTFEEFLSYRF